MNKLLKILTAMVMGAVIAGCGGDGPEAGTPVFGCLEQAASAASGTSGASCN